MRYSPVHVASLHSPLNAPFVQELKESARSKEATGIELIPDESNVFRWRALIKASL